jgi:transposase
LVNHDGYIFSQTVRGANAELKAFVLKENGYRAYGENGYRVKSRIYPRMLHVTEPSGKKQDVDIDEKQVIFYSPEYDRRAKHERTEAVTKARDMIKNPGKYNRITAYGAAKYVNNINFDKKTGEILPDATKLLSFNEDKLKQEEQLDGYYAIVTSECDLPDGEIIELYKGLWKIEEAFKITKSTLDTRPVYVFTTEHIKAHFAICYIALVISRLLERELNGKYPISRIAESLNNVCGTLVDENVFVFDYCDEVTEFIEKTMCIPLTRRYLTPKEILAIVGNTKK